jgi:hypothetical protein
MSIEEPSLNEASIDPRNLQVRFVNETCMHYPRPPGLWGEPRFDQQDTTSAQMLYHTLDGSEEVVKGFDVANSAEETGHDVKPLSESKVRHIGMVQGDIRVALTSHSK